MRPMARQRQRIAVVGSGISGLSAAWLLSRAHDVTLYERDDRLGGHANTVEVPGADGRPVAVDTGFIVFNEATYPNFCAMLEHLGVASHATEMSFAVSLDGGRLEYSGTSLGGLFAQRRNIVSPRFWSMLQDLLRFYRSATRDAAELALALDLARRLSRCRPLWPRLPRRPPAAHGRRHLVGPLREILSYPASAFIRFHNNHGLLKLSGRPAWRTVVGGSRSYVKALREDFTGEICSGMPIARIRRTADGVILDGEQGWSRPFDQVVIATHAKEALAMLAEPTAEERDLLGAFRYSRNLTVLHTDEGLMPRRRAAWSSWNHIGERAAQDGPCAVTYWMNRLQHLPQDRQFFVTLNPPKAPREGTVLREEMYEHPLFDSAAIAAQQRLWSLQGVRRTWFCGAHFGAGFHEDGLQAGLPSPRTSAASAGPGRSPMSPAASSPRRDRAADGGGVSTGASALYVGRVMHRRTRPRPHALAYRVFWVLLDLDEIDALDGRLRLFSRDRANVFSFRTADYGDRSGRPCGRRSRSASPQRASTRQAARSAS